MTVERRNVADGGRKILAIPSPQQVTVRPALRGGCGNTGASTDIHPRETAWLLDEMSDIENDKTRYLSVRSEARRLQRKTEAVLSE